MYALQEYQQFLRDYPGAAQNLKDSAQTKILELREHLGVNQTDFGHKLESSAMAVSRWERGAQEPPSHSYIEIGNLAGDPMCWYFWERA